MSWLMIAGGFPMLFVLVFGAVGLVSALRYAWSPAPGRLGHIAATGMAVLFSALAGVAADLMMVTIRVNETPEWANSPDLHLILLAGLGESLAPAVLGFSILAVTALFVALGLRRAGPAWS